MLHRLLGVASFYKGMTVRLKEAGGLETFAFVSFVSALFPMIINRSILERSYLHFHYTKT